MEFIKKLSKWLPKEIIDSHSHASAREQCKFLDGIFLSRVSSTFPWFEIDKHMRVNRVFYPLNKVKMLVFPIAHRGIDHRAANAYIAREADRNPLILPILYGIPDDIEYTLSKLKTGRFLGLKMYPAYFFPPAQKISEYFPHQVLKYCEEMAIPIILHLSCPVVDCRKELIMTARKFPDLKIVLAHMGLAYLPLKNLKKTFEQLSRYENINFDTAMVTSAEVFKTAMDLFGYHRIIYGTDQPLNLVRGRMLCEPKLGIRVITEYSYHWINPKEQRKFSQYAIDTVHLHWEMLLALKKGIQSCEENKDAKEYIFRKNAQRVFNLQ